MTTEKLLDIIGMIDDKTIADAKKRDRRKIISFKRIAALAAALVLCFIISVPVAAVSDNQTAYDMLYAVSPPIAQKLKPIKMSCESSGIKMEVVSVYVHESEAVIYVSMQDMIGDRLDETADLFDSYTINTPFDCDICTATCSFRSFDEETRTATFIIEIDLQDGTHFDSDKITFSVGCIISGKQEIEKEITQIDITNIDTAPKTMSGASNCGWGYSGEGDNGIYDPNSSDFDPSEVDVLVPAEEYICTPTEGVHITGVGFVDDELHIQICKEGENHGEVYLVNKDVSKDYGYMDMMFFTEEDNIGYNERIFNVSPNEIDQYKLFGWFITYDNVVYGDWQVTFSLDDINAAQ